MLTTCHLGIEVPTAVLMNSCLLTSCISLKVNRRFAATCRLDLQGRRINQERNQYESGGKQGFSTDNKALYPRRQNTSPITSLINKQCCINCRDYTFKYEVYHHVNSYEKCGKTRQCLRTKLKRISISENVFRGLRY
jgi:hypothetical protein